MVVSIDCRRIACREDLHAMMKEALAFPDHYGSNLDALHDCLTDIHGETHLTFENWSALEDALGGYARAARRAIGHAAAVNPALAVTFL